MPNRIRMSYLTTLIVSEKKHRVMKHGLNVGAKVRWRT